MPKLDATLIATIKENRPIGPILNLDPSVEDAHEEEEGEGERERERERKGEEKQQILNLQFLDALKNNNVIEELNFCQMDLSSAAIVTALAAMIVQNQKLKKINLHGCKITAAAIPTIAAALAQNSALTELDLSNNGIDNAGAIHLDIALRDKTSRFILTAYSNHITPCFVASLESFLKAPVLPGVPPNVSQKIKESTPKDRALAYVNRYIVSVLQQEITRLRQPPHDIQDQRLAALNETIAAMDRVRLDFIRGDKKNNNYNRSYGQWDLQYDLQEVVTSHLVDNPQLDKYHKEWGQKLGRAILNALFFLTIVPALVKLGMTGDAFFHMGGKSQTAGKQVAATVANLTKNTPYF